MTELHAAWCLDDEGGSLAINQYPQGPCPPQRRGPFTSLSLMLTPVRGTSTQTDTFSERSALTPKTQKNKEK